MEPNKNNIGHTVRNVLLVVGIPIVLFFGMWLALGGGLYTVGCAFYLWKSLPYAHMVWHLFVLAGTICHFFCFLWHVMPSVP